MVGGYTVLNGEFFDTVGVELKTIAARDELIARARKTWNRPEVLPGRRVTSRLGLVR